MPVTTSYPGLYIEELPNLSHTITAAPTSIAVFIGYTHPFLTWERDQVTPTFYQPVMVTDFTEFQTAFGGMFTSNNVPVDLPYAVQQFFLNGGAIAYIVALPAGGYLSLDGPPNYNVTGANLPTATAGGLTFNGYALVEGTLLSGIQDRMLTVAATPNADASAADLLIQYADNTTTPATIVAESFRGITLKPSTTDPTKDPHYIGNLPSSLVQADTTSLPATWPAANAGGSPQWTLEPATPVTSSSYLQAQYVAAMQAEGPLDKLPIFNILVTPGTFDPTILGQAIPFCERKRAFLIVDPPESDTADPIANPGANLIQTRTLPLSTNAAIYYPWLLSTDSYGNQVKLAPSGTVAGIYARIDNSRGVWKAPAGLETTMNNITGVVPWGQITDNTAGILNSDGINAIRTFANLPPVVFGARTLATTDLAFQQWMYVPVRRMALFLEQTLLANLGWVVFEPNAEPLWVAITTSISAFMLTLFHQGAFQGQTPTDAFLVKCDSSTTTQTDIDNGIVNILVGFAPLKPAEFVIIQIAQLAGQQ